MATKYTLEEINKFPFKSNYRDVIEKDINLLLSKKLESTLTSKGAIVYLTRDGDYDLASENASNRKNEDLRNF